MNIEFFCLGLLSVLLVGSNVYWARLLKEMTARVMSKNHHEFVQAELLKAKPRARKAAREDEMAVHPDDERQAQELNVLMGMV